MRTRILFFAALLLTQFAAAEGMLPGKPTQVSTAPVTGPLLLGQPTPENLIVLSASGTQRTLLSFKALSEVMVVSFFSSQCANDPKLLDQWRRLYEEYKDWHVSFVVVAVGGKSDAGALLPVLQNAGILCPIIFDPNNKIVSYFGITATPQLIVLDESAILRYRGPLNGCYANPDKRPCRKFASQALDATIGHVEAVPVPEPGMTGGCPL